MYVCMYAEEQNVSIYYTNTSFENAYIKRQILIVNDMNTAVSNCFNCKLQTILRICTSAIFVRYKSKVSTFGTELGKETVNVCN